jgi:hypothetical protein
MPADSFSTRDGFLSVFNELRDELLAELPAFGMTDEVINSMREVRFVCRHSPAA